MGLRLTFGLWLLLATTFQGLSAFGVVQLSPLSPSIILPDALVTFLGSRYFCWVSAVEYAIREKNDLSTRSLIEEL